MHSTLFMWSRESIDSRDCFELGTTMGRAFRLGVCLAAIIAAFSVCQIFNCFPPSIIPLGRSTRHSEIKYYVQSGTECEVHWNKLLILCTVCGITLTQINQLAVLRIVCSKEHSKRNIIRLTSEGMNGSK